jgi:hypothetical protein
MELRKGMLVAGLMLVTAMGIGACSHEEKAIEQAAPGTTVPTAAPSPPAEPAPH